MTKPKAAEGVRLVILSDPRSAILMAEILGPPIGLRPPSEER